MFSTGIILGIIRKSLRLSGNYILGMILYIFSIINFFQHKQETIAGTECSWFLSCSTADFRKEFINLYLKSDTKVANLYRNILEKLKLHLVEDDWGGFSHLIKLISIIKSFKPDEKICDQSDNPFASTNLVILACLNNNVRFLQHIFEYLDVLHEHVESSYPNPKDKDGTHHNAFYYAIRSNNVRLVQILIRNYFDRCQKDLDDLIATSYHELQLKNVQLSEEMRFFLESKLLDLRFYSRDRGKLSPSLSSIGERIVLIIDSINMLPDLKNNVDEKFMYISKFLAKNIYILKRILKSTYIEIPWEEIEFCLLCFIISKTRKHKLNMYYSAAVPTERMVSHLRTFSKKLHQLKNSISETHLNDLQKLPNMARVKIISDIIKSDPQFEDLYNDFTTIRDVTSLSIISKYVTYASNADPHTSEGRIIVTRMLTVLGEHLKNTLESPKLSATVSNLLLVSLPKSTNKILIKLRNSLTHGNVMALRMAIEDMSPDLFVKIKDDLNVISNTIRDIIYNYENQWIQKLLHKIVNFRSTKELTYIFELLQKTEDTEISYMFLDRSEKSDKMVTIFDGLKNIINNQSLCQQLNDMRSLFTEKQQVLKNIDFHVCLMDLKHLGMDSTYIKFDEISLRSRQFMAKRILRNRKQEELSFSEKKGMMKLPSLLKMIKSGAEFDKVDDMLRYFAELFHLIELDPNNVKFLTEFSDILENNKLYNEEYNFHGEEISKSLFNNTLQLEKKLCEIKSCLDESELQNFSSEKFSSFKNKKNLHIVMEMQLLDILSILENTGTNLDKNLYLFDEPIPSIFGKSLRNHLAHGNLLVDVVCQDFLFILLLNCQKMVKEYLLSNKRPIGGPLAIHYIEKNLKSDLKHIDLQQKMFTSIETGDLVGLKDSVNLGADIHGTDMEMKTTVHYAAKCSTLEIMEYLVSQNVTVNSTDVFGQNPLHISASFGSKSTAAYFIREKLICIDGEDSLKKTALHIASVKGHKDIVEFLLASGANHSLKDFQGKSPLHKAIEHNQVEVTRILLERDVSAESNEILGGFTPLHQAAECGSFEVTELLLLRKANVNARSDKNASALHLAAFYGHVNVVEALISAGADINAGSADGGTPLHNAVEIGHDQVVEILLKYGADVNVSYSGCRTTPLHYAAAEGREKIAKMLLKAGAKVNIYTEQFKTPLHFAAEKGCVGIVLELLMHGANINALDFSSYSALHIAIETGHEEVVKILIRKGINVNGSTISGSSPVHLAAMKGNAKMLTFLLENAAVFETRDKQGLYPLHLAAQNGNVDVIRILLQNGSDINIKDSEGSTPIALAIANNHLDATKYLLNRKAQVSIYNYYNLTPFYYAITSGHLDIVKLLLDHKRELISEYANITPLHLAVQQSKIDIVEVLLDYGAEINEISQDGMTALCYAVKNNDEKLVEFIIQNGGKIHAANNRALFLASESGYKEIVDILLKKGADPNGKLIENETPLYIAVTRGHKHALQRLIEYGAEINISDSFGCTPLHIAALMGYKDIVAILLKNGAKPNRANIYGEIPLHSAMIKPGNERTVEILLKHGSNIRVKDFKNRLPIELAVAYNHIEIVKILLLQHNKSEINMKGNDNYTLLHIAAENGRTEIVELLIQNGADVHSRNKLGSQPIHLATRQGFKNIVELLFKHGCDINATGHHNQTLLHYAAIYGKLVKFLLSRGAYVNGTDSHGLTPLHIAAKESSKETVQVLLEGGAIFDARDKYDSTPLMNATSKDVIDILSFTHELFQSVKNNNCKGAEINIKSGAFINARNTGGNTPLHFAAWKNFEEVVTILLNNKAHTSITNTKGFTPLHYASKFSHLNIVKTLLLYGAIFNIKSGNDRTPMDMATDNKITDIFRLVTKMFEYVEDSNILVLNELKALPNKELVQIIMNARNSNNESLIVVAMRVHFPYVESLKSILQEDALLKILEASFLMSHDKPQKAVNVLQPVFEERQKILGNENPGTLDIEESIAAALYKSGSYEKALLKFKELLNKQHKIFGKHSKPALSTENTIALVLHRQHKNEEAYKIYQKVCPQLEQIAGLDDESTLDAKFHMALVLNGLGKFDEALSLNQEVFTKRSKKYGENHPNTVKAQNNIAMVLTSQRKCEEAIKIYNEVYEKKKKIFGVNHTSTLNTKHSIASAYHFQGNYSKVIEICQELLVIQKQILSPDHELNLRVQHSLGEAFIQQGKLISAYETYREIVKLSKLDFLTRTASDRIEFIKTIFRMQGDITTIDLLQNHHDKLIEASSLGDLVTVRGLLQLGGKINGTDINGCTPLHHAATNGHVEVVMTLLKNGADPTFITNKANTTLHLAVSNGFNNVVMVLLKHIKNNALTDFVNASTRSTGTTALHIAAKNGRFDIVMTLLTYNAIYNIKNYQKQTPLAISNEKNIRTLLQDIARYFVSMKLNQAEIIDEIKSRSKDEMNAVLGALNDNKFSLLQVAIQHKLKGLADELAQLMKSK